MPRARVNFGENPAPRPIFVQAPPPRFEVRTQEGYKKTIKLALETISAKGYDISRTIFLTQNGIPHNLSIPSLMLDVKHVKEGIAKDMILDKSYIIGCSPGNYRQSRRKIDDFWFPFMIDGTGWSYGTTELREWVNKQVNKHSVAPVILWLKSIAEANPSTYTLPNGNMKTVEMMRIGDYQGHWMNLPKDSPVMEIAWN